jgi:hypothetical protein
MHLLQNPASSNTTLVVSSHHFRKTVGIFISTGKFAFEQALMVELAKLAYQIGLQVSILLIVKAIAITL